MQWFRKEITCWTGLFCISDIFWFSAKLHRLPGDCKDNGCFWIYFRRKQSQFVPFITPAGFWIGGCEAKKQRFCLLETEPLMYQTEALPDEFRASIWGIKKHFFAERIVDTLQRQITRYMAAGYTYLKKSPLNTYRYYYKYINNKLYIKIYSSIFLFFESL